MMKLLTLLLTGILLVGMPIRVQATTYYVWIYGDDNNTGLSWGDAFETLQKAVAEAQDGDTILIGYDEENGTEYLINSAVMVNKAVVISSARFGIDASYHTAVFDSARCVLNANLGNRLLSITAAAEVRGLGFRKGNASIGTAYLFGYGGAVVLDGAAAGGSVIHHCWFDSNYAALTASSGYGGALAIIDAENGPVVRNNTFTHNVAATKPDYEGYGGAVYATGQTGFRMKFNRFEGNVAALAYDGYGGAVAIDTGDSLTRVQGNDFRNNVASRGRNGLGGGLFLEAMGTVEQNTFIGNIATDCQTRDFQLYGLGGGLYARNSDGALNIVNNTFRQNMAATDSVGGSGGAIYLWKCRDTRIKDNQIEYNTATRSPFTGTGGGIAATGYGTYAIIQNNTLRGNVASAETGEGGAIWLDDGWVENNTIVNNVAATATTGSGKGGGIFTSENTVITGNVFENNVACEGTAGTGWGGAICSRAFDGGARIIGNRFVRNVASKGNQAKGGALFIADTSHVFNNIFKRNVASTNPEAYQYNPYLGDAIYIYYQAGDGLRIYHNVFYRNSNAIFADYLNFTTLENYNVVNNIFYNTPDERNVEMIYSDGDMDIYNNCFYGYGFNNNNAPLKYNVNVFSYAEVDADPRIDTTTFTLQFDSPCIDAGRGMLVYQESENHQQGWKPDIGAYEYTGTRVRQYLRPDMVGRTIYFGGEVRARVTLENATIGANAYIDITVFPGQVHPAAGQGVQRYFTITTQDISDMTLALTLSYRDAERNGEQEEHLRMVRRVDNRWEGPFFSEMNGEENWIRATGLASLAGDWILTTDTTLVGIDPAETFLPEEFRLYPNYPNPFNPSTTIVFDLPQAVPVRLEIFNALGERVMTLVDDRFPPGRHRRVWHGQGQNGKLLTSGVYYLYFQAGSYTQVQKMLLMK
ncbi:MAG: T9SS type A sorting domain-containing protein [Calditrichaeota bacterium]|nr:T9SS type A sorting domain-containing protein [Calditrichota bacterium]